MDLSRLLFEYFTYNEIANGCTVQLLLFFKFVDLFGISFSSENYYPIKMLYSDMTNHLN